MHRLSNRRRYEPVGDVHFRVLDEQIVIGAIIVQTKRIVITAVGTRAMASS